MGARFSYFQKERYRPRYVAPATFDIHHFLDIIRLSGLEAF